MIKLYSAISKRAINLLIYNESYLKFLGNSEKVFLVNLVQQNFRRRKYDALEFSFGLAMCQTLIGFF